MEDMRGAPVLWINGFPGSSKRTVAKIVARNHHPAVALDNHKLIDPVEARFSRDHPDYQKHRRRYRQAVLDHYVRDESTLSRLVIFTDNELGREVANEYRDAARETGRPFIPVYMICDVEANLERIANADRLEGALGKLLDRRILERLRASCELYLFEDDCPSLTVDTTNTPPADTAMRILAFLDRLCPGV
ncbi:hypothetical protein DL767_005823 [Monosporascus sp. MG133]|nr:hypothetical protein DL767_005823 [Monosporascus sp. MG133]